VPASTSEPRDIVICDVPAPVIELGLKLTVAPAGCPLAVKEIAELKPPATVAVIVDVILPLAATVTELGEAPKAKVGAGTMNDIVAVSVALPLVPETTMG